MQDMNRFPALHASTHKSDGSDPIKLSELATPDDNTLLDVTNAYHGLTPKLPNDISKFLNGRGQWSVPTANNSDVGCIIGINSTVGIAQNTRTVISWDKDYTDPQNMHSTTSNKSKIFAPENGRYLVNLIGGWDDAGPTIWNWIMAKNGEDPVTGPASGRYSYFITGVSGAFYFNSCGVIDLSANDYFEMYVSHNAALTNHFLTDKLYLTVQKIGAQGV